MAATTVFFSWQSDTGTSEGRNFIERALEMAVKRISNELQVEEAPRGPLQIDKDTKDVPGSPPIFETIRRKIDAAAIFIPDLSFVAKRPNGDPSQVSDISPPKTSGKYSLGGTTSGPAISAAKKPSSSSRFIA